MDSLPVAFSYTTGHQWVCVEDGQVVRVGITDFAQRQLGDVVFVDLPALGRMVAAGEPCAVVESVKTASDLTSPVSGQITAVNGALASSPEAINDSPYQTWLFCVQADSLAELDGLLDSVGYQRLIAQA